MSTSIIKEYFCAVSGNRLSVVSWLMDAWVSFRVFGEGVPREDIVLAREDVIQLRDDLTTWRVLGVSKESQLYDREYACNVNADDRMFVNFRRKAKRAGLVTESAIGFATDISDDVEHPYVLLIRPEVTRLRDDLTAWLERTAPERIRLEPETPAVESGLSVSETVRLEALKLALFQKIELGTSIVPDVFALAEKYIAFITGTSASELAPSVPHTHGCKHQESDHGPVSGCKHYECGCKWPNPLYKSAQ